MKGSSIESSEHAIEILEGIITYTEHLPYGEEDAINYAIEAIKERDKLVNIIQKWFEEREMLGEINAKI
jgi:hypothetical protein